MQGITDVCVSYFRFSENRKENLWHQQRLSFKESRSTNLEKDQTSQEIDTFLLIRKIQKNSQE